MASRVGNRYMRLTRIAAIVLLGIVTIFAIACGSKPQEYITYCAAGCQTSWLGDGVCQNACNNAACYYDNGDCSSSTPTPASHQLMDLLILLRLKQCRWCQQEVCIPWG